MRILVTGGAGFIGSHVVDAYVAAGHTVAVVDNLVAGKRRNVNPAATLYEVDIRNRDAMEEVFERERPEVVNHHAAQVDVRASVADPAYDAAVNLLGSIHLLEVCRASRVRKVIYSSSGGACYGEPLYLPCDETHPVRPQSGYGASKHAVEHYLHLYRGLHGLDYTVLRYANVYGPRQNPHGEGGVVAIFAYQMQRGEPVTIFGSGEQLRDFVYAGDCASANLLALNAGGGGIYNLGTGEGTSINELFRILRELTGYGDQPVYAPAKLGETFRSYLSAAHAEAELGWRKRVSLREGLERTVRHFHATPGRPA